MVLKTSLFRWFLHEALKDLIRPLSALKGTEGPYKALRALIRH